MPIHFPWFSLITGLLIIINFRVQRYYVRSGTGLTYLRFALNERPLRPTDKVVKTNRDRTKKKRRRERVVVNKTQDSLSKEGNVRG